jgi:hypothetical protein
MTVRSFDSFEAMQQAMRDGIDWGNANLHPLQQAITFGDCWADFRMIHADDSITFGRVFTLDEVRDLSAKNGGTAREVEAEVQAVVAQHGEGMLFGTAASRYFPDGELGDTHRLHMWPISRALYDAAAYNDFDWTRLPQGPFSTELQAAFDAWREVWNRAHQ